MENGNGALQVVSDQNGGMPIEMKAPDIVLAEASKAAKALAQVLESRPKKVVINNKRHLEFDDWQTVAKFYSLAVRTFEAIPTEIDGVKGAKARAEVIDIRTGIVIGGAESYCLRDEVNWRGKPWFQLASMAQTRAGAKAFRNVLSWVVVLAGFSPTPAEEMEQDNQRALAAKPIVPIETNESGPESLALFPVEIQARISKKTGKPFHKVIDGERKEYFAFDADVVKIVKQAVELRRAIEIKFTDDSFGRTITAARFQIED